MNSYKRVKKDQDPHGSMSNIFEKDNTQSYSTFTSSPPPIYHEQQRPEEHHRWSLIRYSMPDIILEDSDDPEGVSEENIRASLKVKIWKCIVAIIIYLILGVIAFSYIFERWSIVDSLYFSVVTFTTVGYGDLYPNSDAGMLFTCVFTLGGVCFLGIALGIIGEHIVESEVLMVDVSKKRFWSGRHGVVNILENHEDGAMNDEPPPSSDQQTIKPNWFSKNRKHHETILFKFGPVILKRKHTDVVLYKFSPVILTLSMGTLIIAQQEDLTWIQAIYYCIITATTCGYGDISLDSAYMRSFGVVFIPLSVSLMGVMIGGVAELVMNRRRQEVFEVLKNHEMTLNNLKWMDSDGDGKVSRIDFLDSMLVALDIVDKETLDELHEQFDRWDVDKTGFLHKGDLELMAKKRRGQVREKMRLASYKYKLTHMNKNTVAVDQSEANMVA